MVSLLTGGQKELTSFCSLSYLVNEGAVENVICNSISPKSGLFVLWYSQQCLAFWLTMQRNHLWVSSLRETVEKKGKGKLPMVFCAEPAHFLKRCSSSVGRTLLPTGKLLWGEQMGLSTPRKYATAIGGWNSWRDFCGGGRETRGSQRPMKIPVDERASF